ncbi:methyltransferase domain-containing protein [Candidatus Uhrbacteria bacterium]|nr:methyltransferase domain-containing protein [Candidatus Uhrbacteria bacterium]
MDYVYIALLVVLVLLMFVTVFVTFVTGTILTSAPWVPTSKVISRKMCEFGGLKKGDRVLDLGCGDASILIVAAQEFGATCVGVELNPMVALMARTRVRLAGVQDNVKIVRENMFTVDLPDVDVVMMYLLPKATHKIEKRLQDRYKHLTVISHGFELASEEVGKEMVKGSTVRKYKW